MAPDDRSYCFRRPAHEVHLDTIAPTMGEATSEGPERLMLLKTDSRPHPTQKYPAPDREALVNFSPRISTTDFIITVEARNRTATYSQLSCCTCHHNMFSRIYASMPVWLHSDKKAGFHLSGTHALSLHTNVALVQSRRRVDRQSLASQSLRLHRSFLCRH